MAVTINGSTGITNVDGSAGTPAEKGSTSATAGMFFPAANTVAFSTSSTEAMRINSSNQVGIGTTSPTNLLHVVSSGDRPLKVTSNSDTPAVFTSSGSANAYLQVSGSADVYLGSVAGAFTVTTGGTEKMRLDTSGNLLVGQSSWSWSNNGTEILSTGRIWNVSNTDYNIELGGSTTARMRFYTSAGGSGTTVGSITVTTGATAYNTTSDYRMKENVQPMVAALQTITALRPVTYEWKMDKSKGEGFIAHELAEVIPLAVTGEKDAVNEDGSIKPQGVDYSKIVVHLVAAIQEQQAQIEELKAKVAALEAKP